MFIPKWLLLLIGLLFAALVVWSGLPAAGRNPMPFPDNGSRIFATPTPSSACATTLPS